MTLATNPLIEARNIDKTYPGVRALDGVSLSVGRGELVALLGENGAGKSTLMKILAGVETYDRGELRVGGLPVRFHSPREAQQAGIAIIHQELNLVPNLSVAENVFLAREPRTPWGTVDYSRLKVAAADAIARLGLQVDVTRPVSELSVASQQVVEIAKALVAESQVLILDEPTSALTQQEVEALFRVLLQLKQQGVGLVYITHRLDELKSIADRICVLRDGQMIGSQPYAGTTETQIVRMMVGRDSLPPLHRAAEAGGDMVLQVERLTVQLHGHSHPAVADVSLEVRRGEIVGLFGLMGAGRTELLEALFGLHAQSTSGTVRVAGQPYQCHSPRRAIAAGLALVPEDRKRDGLVLEQSVRDNAALASLDRLQRAGFVRDRTLSAMVQGYVEQLSVKTPQLETRVGQLSGGNQQKVVLAKWLATRPQVLLLDEPTRGIDIGAKQEIYRLLGQLADQGLALLVVSSELPEVLALCDRSYVLCEGKLTGHFRREESSERKLLQAALPQHTTGEAA